MPNVRFGQAINKAIADAMAQDERVVLFGEDVAAAGGAFGITKGLLAQFGDRVRDTPISEATIVGAAVGAALSGLRPIVEIMFMDFVTIAMDALVNQAAKAWFMFGGQRSVPLVLRTPHGGGISAGPQHSQCLEAWFAHVPGLKVVCPASVTDAYGLMRSAIEDPNPVIFIENKALYAKKDDLEGNPFVPIGKARIIRPGKDVSIITYGSAVQSALDASRDLETANIDAEVIDLRSLQPWDRAAVIESVTKTHRMVVCHEAVEEFGIGAEIVAAVVDNAFDQLDAPPLRVAAPFVPVPFAPGLEAELMPTPSRIAAAVRRTLE